MTANNLVAIYAVFGLAALGGSAITILLGASAAWALVYLALGRVQPRFDGGIAQFTLAVLFYVAVNCLFFALNFGEVFESPAAEFRKLAPQILFLASIPVMWRIALSEGKDLLSALWRGAAIGAVLVLPLAIVQLYWFGQRAEGGSGNSIPFALTCAFLSLASLPGLLESDKRFRVLAILGFLGGFISVFLSQTKGLMPVPLLGALVFALAFFRQRINIVQAVGIVGLLAVVVAIGLYASGSYERFVGIADYAMGKENVELGASYSHRWTLWVHAAQAIGEAPLEGHGIQNRRAVIETFGFGYSHMHNGYLTALVDNGILGLVSLLGFLLSPLWIAWRAPHDALRPVRLFLAFSLVSTYAIGGMTNIIFGHDIYDSLFLWVGIIIAVSATPNPGPDELAA